MSLPTNCVAWHYLLMTLAVALVHATTDQAQGQVGFNATEQASSRWLPPGTSPTNRWKIGVSVQNTPTGVVLTQVVPGSPAAAAGLEVGDSILTAAGQQVGYVDGQLIDLGDVVARNVVQGGRVTLLIQNHRNGQVRNVVISPTGNSGILQGTAVYQEGSAGVSRRAVLTVRLCDRTFPQWSGAVIAETTVSRADRGQIPFQLTYDPSQIFPNHNYWVEAEVRDLGRLTHQGTASWTNVPGIVTLMPVLTTLPTQPGLTGVGSGTQITQWYQQYLGRYPTSQELIAWQNHLARGQSLDQIRAYLLASNEYLARHQHDPDRYLQAVYQSLFGRQPTPVELRKWRREYEQSNGVRSRLIQQLMANATTNP